MAHKNVGGHCSSAPQPPPSLIHICTLQSEHVTFKKFHLFMFGCVGLPCCMQLSLAVLSGGCSPAAGLRLLLVLTSPVVQHGLQGTQALVAAARRLWSLGSVVVAHRLSCPAACEIFLDQGSNVACTGRWILNDWTTTEVRDFFYYLLFFFIKLNGLK